MKGTTLVSKLSRRCAPLILGGALALLLSGSIGANQPADSLAPPARTDSLRYLALTDADFRSVAQQLDIPVAAIRAVVDIEAGPRGKGFNPDHTPIINFDLSMFRQAARRRGIDLSKYTKKYPVVFQPLNRKKYGSTHAAQYARLDAALKIDTVAALEGTFWGMFQIGGFNWKLCGCSSVREFTQMMCHSEYDQLELFGRFLTGRGLDKYIRNRQWAQFALRYNGPGYRKRAYDTRMAAAFARHSSAN